ncbi:MAG: sigma-70 family RNA polymerase sigma factor [Corynebacterium sp.]|nr:sigma-70 family RNA polymerase sigma factor [Corynebacterium sp.]
MALPKNRLGYLQPAEAENTADPKPPPDGGYTGQGKTYKQCTDVQLVTAHFEGHVRAFEEIAARHGARVRMIAQRFVHTDADIDDIVQETLIKLCYNLHKYRGEAALSTWIYRVTTNLSYDFVQRGSKQIPIPVDIHENDINPLLQLTADPGENRLLKIVLINALAQIPKEQRHSMFLVDYLGFSLNEAAEILGVRPGTMKSRRARARTQLRRILASETTVAKAFRNERLVFADAADTDSPTETSTGKPAPTTTPLLGATPLCSPPTRTPVPRRPVPRRPAIAARAKAAS